MAPHTVVTLIAIGIAALNGATVLLALVLTKQEWRERLKGQLSTQALFVVFLLAAGSVLGSLFVQYIAVIPPCDLCWWQRIFLYPVALIAAVGLIKNAPFPALADYVLVLALPGAAVALYQHLLQMLPSGLLAPCSVSNECAIRSIFELGYITMPWMAFSVFAAIILIAVVARKA